MQINGKTPVAKGEMRQALIDLEIQFDDMYDDPKAFSDRVLRKSRDLAAQLDRKQSLSTIEEEFRNKSLRNKDAKEKAEEIHSRILDLVVGEDPEVLANLIPMLHDIESTISNEVKAMAIRQVASTRLSKRHIHLMYMRLKKGIDAYVGFMDLMFDIKLPTIPAKPGNYSDDYQTSGVKIYRIYIQDELEGEIMLQNPFAAAKLLGLEVKFWLDFFDIVKENNGVIKGKNVRLEEVPR